MKISARNQLKGTVKSIETGSVNAIVHIAVGKEAYAIIKATSVMVGVE